MRVAYLVNQYPQPSQSFIRREIVALEAAGMTVIRYTLRRYDARLVDPADEDERQRTRAVLDLGAVALLVHLAVTLLTRPLAFTRAMSLALRVGRRSGRGVVVHAIYLAEACVLLGWLRSAGIEHVHAHFGTNSATVAMLCSALGGPPFSFTTHGPEEFDQPLALSLGEKVQRSAFAVAISDHGRSQLYRWVPHVAWPKLHVVRCGVDAPFLEQPPGPPPSARRLVCVGRLAEQKGHLILVEAAARLRAVCHDFEIVLVGDGPLRGAIEALIDRHGLGATVRLAGWLSNNGVRDAVIDARAMVLPSFAEGLPVALIEAMALGRPVISTYVAAIPELVRPGESGWLVPPGSVESLARAMGEALDAPVETLARMGRAGAARVQELHRSSAQAVALARLFRESRRPAASPRRSLREWGGLFRAPAPSCPAPGTLQPMVLRSGPRTDP